MPCDVARVHAPPGLCVHDFKAIAAVVVSKIEGKTRARLAVQFALPRDAIVRRLAERQNRHRRAAPEEYLVWGKHAAVRHGRGAVESLRGPQNRLHPQTRVVWVPNSLESFQVHVREELVHFDSCWLPRLDRRRESALFWAVLLWRVWRLQLAMDSETVTVLNERRVGVLGAVVRPENAHGTPMSATKRCTTPRMANALFSRVRYGLWKREALFTNMAT